MAWNNRNAEPRREWTEQIIGIVAILVYIPAVFFGMSFVPVNDPVAWWILTIEALLLSWLAVIFLVMLPFVTWLFLHEVGECVCAIMTDVFNYDPRPVRVRDRWGEIIPEKDRRKT